MNAPVPIRYPHPYPLTRPRMKVVARRYGPKLPIQYWAQPAALEGIGTFDPGTQSIEQMAAKGAVITGQLIAALAVIPIAGPIAAAVAAIGVLIANQFSGCGQTCVAASNIANQVGALLQQNFDAYMSAPVHYQSLQAAALNNYDTAWNALVKACSDPSLGAAGQNCIGDRQRGACHYHTSPSGWSQTNGVWTYTPPGLDGSGTTCWNWFVGLRDPIANDPTVVADPAGAGGILGTTGASGLPTNFGPLLIAAAIVVAVMVAL